VRSELNLFAGRGQLLAVKEGERRDAPPRLPLLMLPMYARVLMVSMMVVVDRLAPGQDVHDLEVRLESLLAVER